MPAPPSDDEGLVRTAHSGRYCLVHVPDPFRTMRPSAVDSIALGDLLSDSAIERVRRAAHVVQADWYRHRDMDFSAWRGHSLGAMAAGPALRNELHGVLGNVAAFHELLARRPGTTHIDLLPDAGIVPTIWQQECRRHGIELRVLSEQAGGSVSSASAPPARRHSLACGLKRLRSRLASLAPRRAHHASDVPRVMLLASGSLTLRHADMCAGLRRSRGLHVVRSCDVLSPAARQTMARRATRDAERHFAEAWPSLEHELRACEPLQQATGDGWQLVIPLLRQTYLRRLPEFAATVELALTALSRWRPTLLVTEAQAGNEDFAWSRAAMSRGIPVAAITNELWGLPLHRWNFPPAADYVLLTSPLGRSWWLEQGFGAESLLPTRSRYLDAPARSRRAAERFTVLCTVTRYGPDLLDVPPTHPRRFVRALLAIAAARPHLQFVLKFHPGAPRLEGQTALCRQLAFVRQHAPSNVEIAPLGSPLSDYLPRADCLACSSSSFTIFEALAHRIPCILAPPQSSLLSQCSFFAAMQRLSSVTDLEGLGGEIDAIQQADGSHRTNGLENVFYTEPAPSLVVEQLAHQLHRPAGRGRAA